MIGFRVACACEFQTEGSGRRGVRVAQEAFIVHRCTVGDLPDPGVVGQNRSTDSATQVMTQDGRWLFDREIPEIL